MDLISFLRRFEADFFHHLGRQVGWTKEELRYEFSEALKNTLILTHSRVMKDAKQERMEEDDT